MPSLYLLLTPLGPTEAVAVERSCLAALTDYLDAHPGAEDDPWQPPEVGHAVPTVVEMERRYAKRGLELGGEVRARLAQCRSCIAFEDLAPLESSPLQVALLRFVAGRLGRGLALPGEAPLLPLEELDDALDAHDCVSGFPGLQRGPASRRAPVSARASTVLEAPSSKAPSSKAPSSKAPSSKAPSSKAPSSKASSDPASSKRAPRTEPGSKRGPNGRGAESAPPASARPTSRRPPADSVPPSTRPQPADDSALLRALLGDEAPRSKRFEPGEERASRVLAILEAAQADLDLQVDVRRALVAVDDDARRWAAALMQDGAQGDARVAKVLGIPASRITAAADKLAARLEAVAPSDDD